jgi:hypothetical protein
MDPPTWSFDENPQRLEDYWWYNLRLSERKRYLFLAAVGRRVAPLMREPACVRVTSACEEFADGGISLIQFVDLVQEAATARCRSDSSVASVQAAHDFVVFLTDDLKLQECVEPAELAFGYLSAAAAGELPAVTDVPAWEAMERCETFRRACVEINREFTSYCLDIFGTDPFRPVAFDPVWRTDTAVSLAKRMYESRDFSPMPILADALQDAGCDSDDILNHCRDTKQVHVRGCWVIDLVLGKS